ncbi:helix-turn-helix domain-containing protein [Frankia sp. R82]|uniref:helix-turn-helix transcriptional regulator n=1 Tax=Frankia sp. R82 TaxID=2950553 RepID=UPI00204448AA|nr:helix-turn-helix domain-containing protein [Frankia sp. R82]MCM3882143.1 helix-turn-helix domain-containing protein [Frankia sp. R82]
MDDPLLSYSEIATIAGVSAKTMRNYRAAGRFPPPDELPAPDRPRWRRSTVLDWLATRPGQGARTDLHAGTDRHGDDVRVDGADGQ